MEQLPTASKMLHRLWRVFHTDTIGNVGIQKAGFRVLLPRNTVRQGDFTLMQALFSLFEGDGAMPMG